MTTPLSTQGGHSAKVKMRLLLKDASVVVSQMASDFILVATPVTCPAGPAELLLQVDSVEQIWKIHLPQGASANSRRIPIAKAF